MEFLLGTAEKPIHMEDCLRLSHVQYLRKLDNETLREMVLFVARVSLVDSDVNRVVGNTILHSKRLDIDLPKLMLHAEYLIHATSSTTATASRHVRRLLLEHDPDNSRKLSTDAERLILDIHCDLLAKGKYFSPKLSPVVIRYPDKKAQIIDLISHRKNITDADLEALLSESTPAPIQSGAL